MLRQHSNAKDQAERLNIDQDVQQVLPGVGPLRFLENDDMSRPMIDNSRKNQSSYLDSKQARAKIVNNYDNNTSTSPKKDANESSKAQKYVQGVVGQKQAARTTKPSKQIELDNEVADELAFINVFKKRASELMPSNENPKESKYLRTQSHRSSKSTKPKETRILEIDHDLIMMEDHLKPKLASVVEMNKSSVSLASTASSSSSNSTSLSKYIVGEPLVSKRSIKEEDELSETASSLNKPSPPTRVQPPQRPIEQPERKANKMMPPEVNNKEIRYSPRSLETMLSAGINYWDTLNVSAIQLEELDKIRCIGLAQQETVYLAHLIKTQHVNDKQTKPLQQRPAPSMHMAASGSTTTTTSDVESSSTQNDSSSLRQTEAKTNEALLKTRSNSASSTISTASSDETEKKGKPSSEHDMSAIQTASEIGHEKRTNGKFCNPLTK